MPNTSTATWPALAAGKKAKASEVESKFDFAEHNLWPHSAGTKTNEVHDLGDTDASWRYTYTRAINPTGPATLVVGTTTAADSESAFEVAGAPILLPRLTTAGRDTLTPRNGMMIYNSTAERTQFYENGAWGNVGARIGINKTTINLDTTLSATVFNTSTSGRILHVVAKGPGAGVGPSMIFILDGLTLSTAEITSVTDSAMYLAFEKASVTADHGLLRVLTTATAADVPLDIGFKTTLRIDARTSVSANTSTVEIWWEGE